MPKPKNFDEVKVLKKITNAFWENGYAKTSLNDLVDTTGLNKTSLYNTFGNKEQMFISSLKSYSQKPSTLKSKPSDGLIHIKDFFTMLTQEAISGRARKGCLIMNSSLEMKKNTSDSKHKITQSSWDQRVNLMTEAVTAAKDKEEIKSSVDTEIFSKWLLSQAFLLRQTSKFITDESFFIEIQKNILNILSINSNKRI